MAARSLTAAIGKRRRTKPHKPEAQARESSLALRACVRGACPRFIPLLSAFGEDFMRRFALFGVLWRSFLGSLGGCGSGDSGDKPIETKKRTRFVPDIKDKSGK